MFSAKDRRLLLTTIEQYRNICYKNSDFLAVVHNGTRGLIFVLLLVNVIIWSSYTAKKTGYLFDFFQAQQMQR